MTVAAVILIGDGAGQAAAKASQGASSLSQTSPCAGWAGGRVSGWNHGLRMLAARLREVDVINARIPARTDMHARNPVRADSAPMTPHSPTLERGASELTDARLLADLEPSSGLRLLYERHFVAVFKYVASRVGRDAAHDVVAETFVVAFRRRAAFDSSYESALPWLIGIATNVVRSQRRAERRHLATAPADMERRAAHDPALDEAIARADAAAAAGAVARALRGLTAKEREAFLIHVLAGLEGTELAIALGVSPSAAAVRLCRARAKLRRLLLPVVEPGQEDRQ